MPKMGKWILKKYLKKNPNFGKPLVAHETCHVHLRTTVKVYCRYVCGHPCGQRWKHATEPRNIENPGKKNISRRTCSCVGASIQSEWLVHMSDPTVKDWNLQRVIAPLNMDKKMEYWNKMKNWSVAGIIKIVIFKKTASFWRILVLNQWNFSEKWL